MTSLPRKIILFDIDHTMFDASLYRELMFQLLADLISFEDKERLNQALEEMYISHRRRIGYFDMEVMLDDLAKELDIDLNSKELFEAVLLDEASYEYAIFEETIEVLEEIAKHTDIHIGIFSSGREEHQLRKIETFKKFFEQEHVHILLMKDKALPDIIGQYTHDDLYLVDDILQILYNAKQVHPGMKTIWMKRGHIPAEQSTVDGFEPDYTVTNLREVVPIVSQKLQVKRQK